MVARTSASIAFESRSTESMFPVEEEEDEHADAGSGEVVGQTGQVGQIEAEVVGEAHRAAGEREGRHQQDVEQEEEGHEPAQPEGAKCLPQIEIRPPLPGKAAPSWA